MIEIKDIVITLGGKKINNSSIERKFNFKKNQILEKTGIAQRFVSDKNQTSEYFAVQSAKKLEKKNNLKKVSHIISVTNTPSIAFPSIANYVCSNLNLNKNVHCIGLNSGCTGFVDAILIAYRLIDKNKKNSIIITTSDTYSKFLDKNDRSTIPLFSDGGSAVLIRYSANGMKLKKYFSNTEDNSQSNLIGLYDSNLKIKMNGPNVLSYALSNVVPKLKTLIEKNKKTIVFCHQAGKVVCDAIKNNLKKNVIFPENYSYYGNLVSTSIPNLLNENKELLRKKNQIIFSGFGVGLSQTHAVFTK
tara:strand:- start:234 stop:1142 length:909 start_codon:yes stop_codon:yes gene_type:complete